MRKYSKSIFVALACSAVLGVTVGATLTTHAEESTGETATTTVAVTETETTTTAPTTTTTTAETTTTSVTIRTGWYTSPAGNKFYFDNL